MCFAWSVLYDLSLFFLVYHNHPRCTHLLRETRMIRKFLEYSMCFTYLLSFIVFALVLHLYLLEHGGGFILYKLLIAHASLILF